MSENLGTNKNLNLAVVNRLVYTELKNRALELGD